MYPPFFYIIEHKGNGATIYHTISRLHDYFSQAQGNIAGGAACNKSADCRYRQTCCYQISSFYPEKYNRRQYDHAREYKTKPLVEPDKVFCINPRIHDIISALPHSSRSDNTGTHTRKTNQDNRHPGGSHIPVFGDHSATFPFSFLGIRVFLVQLYHVAE